MQWIYALELLALIGCLWRIGSNINDVANEVRKRGDDEKDEE